MESTLGEANCVWFLSSTFSSSPPVVSAGQSRAKGKSCSYKIGTVVPGISTPSS